MKIEELRNRETKTGTVAFLNVPDFKEHDAATTYRIMVTLHEVLADLKTKAPIRVYSALTGAILILLDHDGGVFFHTLMEELGAALTSQGIPIRMGITHGDLEALIDADGQVNLIGSVINIAARLAHATENKSCLYHQTYKEYARGYGGRDDRFGPAQGEALQVQGKAHDDEIACWTAPSFSVLAELEPDRLSIVEATTHVTGVILAYDLPKFSGGDRATLSSRFRSVIDSLQQLKIEQTLDSPFIFSPGGDGGILVLPVEKKRGFRIAEDLVELLGVESDNKSEGTGVLSRVGLHYGAVTLYENAEGVMRPTGPECLTADSIANGSEAGAGVVISEKFHDVASGGNRSRFNREYLILPVLEDGPAKGIKRYARRSGEDSREGDGRLGSVMESGGETPLADSVRNAVEVAFGESPNLPALILDHSKPALTSKTQDIADIAIFSIESSKNNAPGKTSEFMDHVVACIIDLSDQEFPSRKPTDDAFMRALDALVPLVQQFTKVSRSIAQMTDRQSALRLYRGFGGVLALYNNGKYQDLARFLGHELFVIFVAELLNERQLDIIKEVVSIQLEIRHPHHPIRKSGFWEIYDVVELLSSKKTTIKPGRANPHGDVLQDRHKEHPNIVNINNFMDADLLLYLFSNNWIPRSIFFYMWEVQKPWYLVDANDKTDAIKLANFFGLPDIESLRSMLKSKYEDLRRLFPWGDYFPPRLHEGIGGY